MQIKYKYRMQIDGGKRLNNRCDTEVTSRAGHRTARWLIYIFVISYSSEWSGVQNENECLLYDSSQSSSSSSCSPLLHSLLMKAHGQFGELRAVRFGFLTICDSFWPQETKMRVHSTAQARTHWECVKEREREEPKQTSIWRPRDRGRGRGERKETRTQLQTLRHEIYLDWGWVKI